MKFVKILVVGAGALILLIGAAYLGLSWSAGRVLAETYQVHESNIPMPWPMAHDSGAPGDATREEREALAMDAAIARGEKLLQGRYGCGGCHTADFGGGPLVDDPMIGVLWAPNITEGRGSRTIGYTMSDWERIVRHGVAPDGTPSIMPAMEFRRMADQELSDIVAYIRSRPPVDRETPPVDLGPVMTAMMGLGKMELTVDLVPLDGPHDALPPEEGVTVEFGAHMAAGCVGCHGMDLSGGPITGGPPAWPDAANLTPHEDGLGSWTREDLYRALKEGVRPDGTQLLEPMTDVLGATSRMSDTELDAIWLYLQSIEPVASGR